MEDCLYLLFEVPRERIEDLVHTLVVPVATAVRNDPALDSLFFVRASEPAWELRLRLLGDAEWLGSHARAVIDSALPRAGNPPMRLSRYEREYDRYGGPVGMRLCERLFHHDTLAVLEWMAIERSGEATWTRREFALLLAERIADGFVFDRDGRLGFYRQGFTWAFDNGTWGEREREVLDATFTRNQAGLAALVGGAPAKAGTAAERACLDTYTRAAAPTFVRLVTGLKAGEIRAHAPYLAWSLAHMATNRLGLDPAAEAILRHQAWRLFAET